MMNARSDLPTSAFDVAVLNNASTPSPSESSLGGADEAAPDLSIVIPAMNEEDSLMSLHERVLAVCERAGKRVEIIFIDDGSSDATWERMSRLAREHAGTRAIQFRRNFGKAAALSAGFSIARGAIVITMDADLQDDPDEIPRFLAALAGGTSGRAGPLPVAACEPGSLDVISGWKRVRHDPWHKVLPSRVFNAMVSAMTGVRLHDHNCGFKAYRREVLWELDLYGERHRFIPVLAAARGWKVGEIEVLHHPRVHGRSKYGISRLGKGFLDLLSVYLLTDYARRPLHLIGSAGLACFALGSAGLFCLSAAWVISRLGEGPPLHLHATAIFYYCILAMLLGAQCVLAGLIAELIVSVSAARDRSLRAFQKQGAASNTSGDMMISLPLHHVSFSISQVAGFEGAAAGKVDSSLVTGER